MSVEGLDPVYREAALRAGRMVLFWGGLETKDGTALSPAGERCVEAFLDAIGNSSMPEAAQTVGDLLLPDAVYDLLQEER